MPPLSARYLRFARSALLAMLPALLLSPITSATPGQPGTLDPFWATGSPLGPGKLMSPIGTRGDNANALALQPDGKIVVTGYCLNVSATAVDFCLVRYSALGALDTSFGSGGIVTTAVGDGQARALALQPGGKIIAAGTCWNGSNNDFCLARYTAAGALDTSFGSGGKVITPFGSSTGFANAVALQPDGKIVVAGYCSNGSDNDFCLARYTPLGALDTGFGSGGKVITAMGIGNDSAAAVALQPDGKIVLAGTCYNGSNDDFCLARYTAAGA